MKIFFLFILAYLTFAIKKKLLAAITKDAEL